MFLDLIKGKFPWYRRMHELAGASPVASRIGVSNSSSSLDLSVLDREDESFDEDRQVDTVCCFTLDCHNRFNAVKYLSMHLQTRHHWVTPILGHQNLILTGCSRRRKQLLRYPLLFER